MAVFTYQGRGAGGTTTGEIEAQDRTSAVGELRRRAILVTKINEKSGGKTATKAGGKVKDKEMAIFTRQFSTMIDAGLPLVQCLNILSEQSESTNLRDVTGRVARSVEQGSTLAEALRRNPRTFDDLFVNLVEVGETGGILDTVFQRLAAYIEKAAALKRKVKSAMIYPASIIGVAGLVVVFMLTFVIPTFTKAYYRSEKGRSIIDALLLKLPVIGTLIRKVAVARFTRTLGTLVSSGVPILEGLRITARTAGNKVVEKAVMQCRAAVTAGKTLAEPLKASGVFPPMVIQMISVGEQTGALDEMLTKIAVFYEAEVDTAVDALTSIIEPIMIVVMGGIVGGMVISMYLPMFKLISVVAGGGH